VRSEPIRMETSIEVYSCQIPHLEQVLPNAIELQDDENVDREILDIKAVANAGIVVVVMKAERYIYDDEG